MLALRGARKTLGKERDCSQSITAQTHEKLTSARKMGQEPSYER